MGRCFYPITPVDLTPVGEVGAWATVQCNPYVNSLATGAIVHFYAGPGSNLNSQGLRKTGGTAGIGWIRQNGHEWAIVGLDGLRRFDYYRGFADQGIYLVGFTLPGVEFLTNELDITPGVKGSWQTEDLSAECPDAIAIIYRMVNLSWVANRDGGIRANGSGEDTFGMIKCSNQPGYHSHFFGVTKCDGSQIVQVKIANFDPTVGIFVTGWVTAGANFYDVFYDRSVTVNGYKEIDVSAIDPEAGMAFVRIVTSEQGTRCALRSKGSAEDIFGYQLWARSFAFIEVDTEGKFEGKVESNNTDFWIMGTAKGPDSLHGFPMPQVGAI